MGSFRRFEDIEVWKRARVLANEVYELTSRPAFSRDYALKNQINAAAGSIMHNVAEGFERSGNKEFVQFLYISKGSSGEVRSQLYLAHDRGYLTTEEQERLTNETVEIGKMLGGLISHLKRSPLRGPKYVQPHPEL